MGYKQPSYFKQCVYLIGWKIKETLKKKPRRYELMGEIAEKNRENEKLEAKADALEELLAQERDKTRDLRKENAALSEAAKARRSSLVPHCRNCPSLQRREPKVGKIVCTCIKKPETIISVMEGRTSPKWCPLRSGTEASNEE